MLHYEQKALPPVLGGLVTSANGVELSSISDSVWEFTCLLTGFNIQVEATLLKRVAHLIAAAPELRLLRLLFSGSTSLEAFLNVLGDCQFSNVTDITLMVYESLAPSTVQRLLNAFPNLEKLSGRINDKQEDCRVDANALQGLAHPAALKTWTLREFSPSEAVPSITAHILPRLTQVSALSAIISRTVFDAIFKCIQLNASTLTTLDISIDRPGRRLPTNLRDLLTFEELPALETLSLSIGVLGDLDEAVVPALHALHARLRHLTLRCNTVDRPATVEIGKALVPHLMDLIPNAPSFRTLRSLQVTSQFAKRMVHARLLMVCRSRRIHYPHLCSI
ncbi:hypothetical protein BKA62DRAFT_302157 [Auriculariales sp. MPI-PUGE-AT-0066]|nr:hypothetical protein BKA62DRAFT_302157 [Auriculariales sp. MPI-PUGE-AT-0066]